MNTNQEEVVVHWFRHGLRLHDNPSLIDGLSECDRFYPVFIFDGEVAGTKTAGYNRFRFLLECLQDLDKNLKAAGTRLYCFQGQPTDILERLIEEWGVTKVTFEADPEPIWQERDRLVRELLDKKNVQCVEKVSHTLWDPYEIIENNGGSPPLTFSLFNLVTSTIGPPPRPVEDPDFTDISLPVSQNHDKQFGIPTLEDLNVRPECEEQNKRLVEWLGGESKALELLAIRMKHEETAYENGYVMPNQYHPDLLSPPLSLSAHLRFGCLSVRKFYWSIHDKFEEVKPSMGAPVSLSAQLMWREYFYTMAVNNIDYDKMETNPICLNIPWYDNPEHEEKWTQGETGYPWIDAIMKQLRYEGWVHHVARHAVSCFLTRGDLWLNWEVGLKVFYKYLLDADWSVCAGNWMWVSSSAFEKVLQCPNCFCPVRYGKRMDPSGEYVRRYLPVLKDMPLRYLFEPWKAPLPVQQKAKCIVGVDYPKPMVDHQKASKECIQNMKAVKDALMGREIPHCAPSEEIEARRFSWLPDHTPSGGHCTANFLCDGLKDMN